METTSSTKYACLLMASDQIALTLLQDELVIGIEPALQAMRIKEKDPAAFVERMGNMMKWMNK